MKSEEVSSLLATILYTDRVRTLMPAFHLSMSTYMFAFLAVHAILEDTWSSARLSSCDDGDTAGC